MSTILDLKNLPEPEVSEPEPTEVAEQGGYFLGGPETISWEAVHVVTDIVHRRRKIIILALALLGIIIAVWQSSWLTFLAIMVGLGAWELTDRFPHRHNVTIDRHGMDLDGHFYPHTELTSFDIHIMPDDVYELSLKTTNWHIPHIRLPLGEKNPEEIHAFLSQYVPNERHTPSVADYWLRKQ